MPRKNFCVPIAQALGIEAEYVMACMEVARRRALNLAYWRKQASREFHAAAIDAVNALLSKAAESYDREGHEYLSLARTIRGRAHSMQAYPDSSLDRGNAVHTIPDLIYALQGKLGDASDFRLAKIVGVRDTSFSLWRRGERVPLEKYAVSLAHALGIDSEYARTCRDFARHRDTMVLQSQPPRHYVSSIHTVNSLLEKSATHYEKEASLQFERAAKLRERLGES